MRKVTRTNYFLFKYQSKLQKILSHISGFQTLESFLATPESGVTEIEDDYWFFSTRYETISSFPVVSFFQFGMRKEEINRFGNFYLSFYLILIKGGIYCNIRYRM